MPPISFTKQATEGTHHASPFIGPVNHTEQMRINPTLFTSAEIDQDGRLKPGVPLSPAGILVGATIPVHGCVYGFPKVAKSNSSADIAAATPVDVAVATIGQVNRDQLEATLGRALTANELAGFALGGCRMVLVQ